jgi:hypothetical protein
MTTALAINLLLALIDHAQQISAIIQAAQSAGRTDLTSDEWNTILASDDKARAALVAAIAAGLGSAARPATPG